MHAGRHVDPATGAVALPIPPATTFERDPDGRYPRGHLYSRNGNPTRSALETCLGELEGGVAAAAFASASAATAAVCLSLAPGDHVVAPTDAYHGTLRLLREKEPDTEWFLIVGGDIVPELPQWKSAEELPELARVCLEEASTRHAA